MCVCAHSVCACAHECVRVCVYVCVYSRSTSDNIRTIIEKMEVYTYKNSNVQLAVS